MFNPQFPSFINNPHNNTLTPQEERQATSGSGSGSGSSCHSTSTSSSSNQNFQFASKPNLGNNSGNTLNPLNSSMLSPHRQVSTSNSSSSSSSSSSSFTFNQSEPPSAPSLPFLSPHKPTLFSNPFPLHSSSSDNATPYLFRNQLADHDNTVTSFLNIPSKALPTSTLITSQTTNPNENSSLSQNLHVFASSSSSQDTTYSHHASTPTSRTFHSLAPPPSPNLSNQQNNSLFTTNISTPIRQPHNYSDATKYVEKATSSSSSSSSPYTFNSSQTYDNNTTTSPPLTSSQVTITLATHSYSSNTSSSQTHQHTSATSILARTPTTCVPTSLLTPPSTVLSSMTVSNTRSLPTSSTPALATAPVPTPSLLLHHSSLHPNVTGRPSLLHLPNDPTNSTSDFYDETEIIPGNISNKENEANGVPLPRFLNARKLASSSSSSSSFSNSTTNVHTSHSYEGNDQSDRHPTPSSRVANAPSSLPQPPSRPCITADGHVYEVIRKIGQGGTSVVYEAVHQASSVPVAIKQIFFNEHSSYTIESCKEEAKLLVKLKDAGCASVVTLYDSYMDPGGQFMYLIMELGVMDMHQLLQRHMGQPKNMNFIRYYFTEMVKCVHDLHACRIIHADLKPSNFLVTERGLKLIDFGISKKMSNDTSGVYHDHQIGTLNYMPPEALSGVRSTNSKIKLTRKSDIWSLGAILYYMLYDETPFQKLSTVEKLATIPNHRVSIAFPTVRGLHTIFAVSCIEACLNRDPESRPEAGELLFHPFVAPDLHMELCSMCMKKKISRFDEFDDKKSTGEE